MVYPQAPWTLKGYAIVTLHLIDIKKVRSLIPNELNIVSLLPGKTIGCVYLSSYSSGSVLEYSELIVAPALVSYKGKLGGWVSHIYVDSANSVAGGRDIWGLPKELAEFTWENSELVTVQQGNRKLCSLNYQNLSWSLQPQMTISSFSTMGTDLLMFPAKFSSRLGLVGSKLEIPTESPFADLDLGNPFLTVRCEDLNLLVDAPATVGLGTDYERI
jgi:Acetoacetate decarboxylase (ADC)